jgi:hypothetical protein
MADEIEDLKLTLLPDGAVGVNVGSRGTARTVAELLAMAPRGATGQLAVAVNRLTMDGAFVLIEDPAAYEATYRARLAAEDPAQPWREGVSRVRDFGVPDFTEITQPTGAGKALVYFAYDAYTFLPFRVAVVGDAPDYQALTLRPMPEPPPEVVSEEGDVPPDPASLPARS